MNINGRINIEELVERRVDVNYPTITILHPNNTVPLIMRDLRKGDRQLIIEHAGKKKVVANIELSALNIDMLLRTTGELKVNTSPEEHIYVSSIAEFLEYVAVM